MTRKKARGDFDLARAGALAATVLALSLLVVVSGGVVLAVDQPAPVTVEEMQGLVFDGLTAEQTALAVSILNGNGCDCSCGMTIARCRRDDSKCTRSLALGAQVIDMVRQGKGRDEIVKSVLPPPAELIEFALAPGDAPSVGPPDAKVTILHYTDYQ